MKVPRDLSAADLEKALHRAFGYQFVRQLGSHRRLTSQTGGLDICAAPRPSLQSALKARSIPAQGNTLGKPASLGSCALKGRSPGKLPPPMQGGLGLRDGFPRAVALG
jgi:predicted RNA binding protein YcfA (HicA-like mRNA interferase family)